MHTVKHKIYMFPDYREGNPYQILLEKAIKEAGVQVQFMQGYRRVFPLTRAIRAMSTDQMPDALHLNWYEPFLKGNNGLTAWIYAKKFLADLSMAKRLVGKLVWTVHNRVSHESTRPSLELSVAKQIAKLADRLIVHSCANQEEISAVYGVSKSKIDSIPMGHYRDSYDATVEMSVARAELGLPLDGPLFFHFGMLRPYKGIEKLIRCWKEYYHSDVDGHLLIVGKCLDPDFENQLKRLAKGCPGILLKTEFIPDEQMHLYLSAATISVLPFSKVLNSSSIILAMSFDCPVIAPNFPALVEAVGFESPLFYQDSDEGLVTALGRWKTIDLDDIRKKTRKKCDEYGWDEVAQKTIESYGLQDQVSKRMMNS